MFILSRAPTNIIRPSVDDLFRALLNSSMSRPAFFAKLSESAYIFVIISFTAVDAISAVTIWSSMRAPKASISSTVIPVCFATAPMRAAKSTKEGADAAQFCDRVFIADPTASIDLSVPILSSSSNIPANCEIVCGASSPISSIATFMIFPALTNSMTDSTVFLPSRPAADAKSFSSSRDVRVSNFLNSSLSSSTSSRVMPVYFCVSARAESMSA